MLTPFRNWLNEKWFEHRDECDFWRVEPAENPKAYFQKYKWWLKREYRHCLKLEQEKQQRRQKYGF